jgi:hypothetical protein
MIEVTKADLERARLPFYRCINCHRLLTKIELVRAWKTAEIVFRALGKTTSAVCPCGGNKINGTNPTEEELALHAKLYGTTKQFLRYFVLGKSDNATRLWEAWYRVEKNGSWWAVLTPWS